MFQGLMALLLKLRKPNRAYEKLKAEKEIVEAKLNDVLHARAAEQNNQRSEIQALSTKVNQLSSARAADWDTQRREIEAISAKFNQIVAAYAKIENNQRGVNRSLLAPYQTGDQQQYTVAEPGSSATNPFQTQRTSGHLFTAASSSIARKPVAPRQVRARFRSYLEIANEEAENENRLARVLRQEQEDADRCFGQSLVDDEER
ncbi:hypothetical protein E8E14_009158 [Neopestalotiopsis sp. 37M]|nr:hypothetical protein E8E14_009158 [Neopestalotiopsis sp. 37M]